MPAKQHSTYPFQYGGVTYGLLAGVHTPTNMVHLFSVSHMTTTFKSYLSFYTFYTHPLDSYSIRFQQGQIDDKVEAPPFHDQARIQGKAYRAYAPPPPKIFKD